MSNHNQSARIKELIHILWNWSKGYRPCGIATIEKAIDELKEQSDVIVPRTTVNVQGFGAIESDKDFLRAFNILKSHYIKTAQFKLGDWVIGTNVQSSFLKDSGYTPTIGVIKGIECKFDSDLPSVSIVYTIAQIHKNRESTGSIVKIPEEYLLPFNPEKISEFPSKRFVYQGWLIKAMAFDANVFKLKGKPEFLVEQIQEDIDKYGEFLSVRLLTSDRELTQEEFQQQISECQPITGPVNIDFGNKYDSSDVEYVKEIFNVGNTNILKELKNAIGEYVVIEIICDF